MILFQQKTFREKKHDFLRIEQWDQLEEELRKQKKWEPCEDRR